mgnify:CR=1 FL=1
MTDKILFEYGTSNHHPNDPDLTTQVVTPLLMEDAIEYYIDGLSDIERRELLHTHMYEIYYDRITDSTVTDQSAELFISELVDDYIKDTT